VTAFPPDAPGEQRRAALTWNPIANTIARAAWNPAFRLPRPSASGCATVSGPDRLIIAPTSVE